MHTPGPWTYSQRERAPWKFEIHTPTIGGPSMPTEYRREIALTTDGNEANARLIAAAPALFANLDPSYLDEIADHLTGHCQTCDSYAESLTEWAKNQRAALALAKGE